MALLLGIAVDCNATAAPPTYLPRRSALRSELWQMEYRQPDEQPVQDSPNPSRDAQSMEQAAQAKDSAAPSVAPAANSAEESAPGNPSAQKSADAGGQLPGEPQAEQLTIETPLAEWQLDAAAEPATVTTAVPTDWQISRATGFTKTADGIGVDGPSAVTFAVAIVAGIVVTGAMFTGRE